MNTNRSIALLHLGERATQFYMQRLSNYRVDLIPCDFAELNEFLPDQFQELTPRLEKTLDACQQHDAIVIPNITLHETLDKHCQPFYQQLPILHPLASAATKLDNLTVQPIAILGSTYTMRSPYVAHYFDKLDRPVIQLHHTQQQQVDELRRAVYERSETSEQLSIFKQLLTEYRGKAELVIACTELSLVLNLASACSDDALDLSLLQLETAAP